MYRFKTEEEFIKEFGGDWRRNLINFWNNQMNYLLGKEIPRSAYFQILEGTGFTFGKVPILNKNKTLARNENWTISPDMVTNKPLPKRRRV